ncbi:hypothetical protein BC826DRAFT_1045985, partial [Russula brevipes]
MVMVAHKASNGSNNNSSSSNININNINNISNNNVHSRRCFSPHNHHHNRPRSNSILLISPRQLQDMCSLTFLKQLQFHSSLLLLLLSRICTVNNPNNLGGNFSPRSNIPAIHSTTHHSNNSYTIHPLSTSHLLRGKSSMGQPRIIAGLSRFLLPRSSSHLHNHRRPLQARCSTINSRWAAVAFPLAAVVPRVVVLWAVAVGRAIGAETVVAEG